eukprot:EG_transcript_6474
MRGRGLWPRCLVLAVALAGLWVWATALRDDGTVALWRPLGAGPRKRSQPAKHLPWRRSGPVGAGPDAQTAAALLGLGGACLLVVLWAQWTAAAPAVRWSLGQLMRSRRRNAMCGLKVLQLHDDVWLQISDYLETRTLSLVCSSLWRILRHRHLSCDFFDSHTLHRLAQRLQCDSALVTLRVHCHYLGATGAEALAAMQRHAAHRTDAIRGVTVKLRSVRQRSTGDFSAVAVSLLRHAPALRSLGVTLWGNDLGDDGMRTLALLAKSPTLEALNLNLWCNRIGNSGAQALSALKDCPRLRKLTLGLSHNQIGYEGARALALLRQSTTLRGLSLVLSVNALSDGGAHALAELRHVPGLRSLALDLGDNAVGDGGTYAMSTLHSCPTLRKLSLTLWCNYIGDQGARSLVDLTLAPHLQDLRLNLRMNRIRADGAAALATLWRCPALRRLTLDLGNNALGDLGAATLVALAQAPALTSLELGLAGTGLTDAAARALAGLHAAPQLRSLTLGLADNTIGDEGAGALTQLRDSCGLRTLTLDLTDNLLTRRGVRILQALVTTPLLDVTVLVSAVGPAKPRGARPRPRLAAPSLLDLWNTMATRFITRYQTYPEYVLASYRTL